MQISRSTATVAVTVTMAALALAACGSSTKSGSPSASGGGPSSAAAGGKTVEIGFQGPLSGDSSQLGLNALYGLQTAVDEANAAHTLPYTLALKKADDMGSPDQGPTAAQSLTADANVVAVVGPMFSGATKASEPFFSQANLLSVTPSATNPALTSDGFTTFFREIPSDTAQGTGAADYMAKVLKGKKIYVLDDKSDYGTGLSGSIDTELTKDGVTPTKDGIAPTKDYSAEASKIIAAAPDVLYYAGYYADFGLLSKALHGAGFKGTMMSGDGSLDPAYVTAAGVDAAAGTYFSCGCGDSNADPKQAAFVAALAKSNPGSKAGTYSGEAYDALNSIISILKPLGANPTRAAVATAYKTVDYTGLTKQVKFQANGEIASTAVYIYKTDAAGKINVLGPTTELIK